MQNSMKKTKDERSGNVLLRWHPGSLLSEVQQKLSNVVDKNVHNVLYTVQRVNNALDIINSSSSTREYFSIIILLTKFLTFCVNHYNLLMYIYYSKFNVNIGTPGADPNLSDPLFWGNCLRSYTIDIIYSKRYNTNVVKLSETRD